MEAAQSSREAVALEATLPSQQSADGHDVDVPGASDDLRTLATSTSQAAPQNPTLRNPAARGGACGSIGGGCASVSAGGSEGTTIFVGNLSEDLADVVQLSGHFKKFGQIVNVQVRPEQRHAFVQFRNRSEAL